MVTKNLVHIESIDVGAAPLVSTHSIVQSVCFRFYRPLALLPDSGGFAIGDPRSAPPDQCAAKVAAWACSAELNGPAALDLAYAPLVRLALCARHREAGDPALPAKLATAAMTGKDLEATRSGHPATQQAARVQDFVALQAAVDLYPRPFQGRHVEAAQTVV
jgi:hypothetical protein